MPDWLVRLHAEIATTPIGVLVVSFLVCFVSGFVPLVNAEAYLVSVSALCSPAMAVPLALAAALGQMSAKALLFLSGRGVVQLPLGRYSARMQARMEATRARLESHRRHTAAFLFASAFTGLPPFYFVSILAGALRLPFVTFALAGLAGRCLRFGLFIGLPQALRAWL